ncbi:MupG family TIM beta-alpha barrel fold protein [Clostridium disporicum]|uniref:MupG family TIM beta-alpha barrel fold protein n=1 Tax=Clostridium disporicum TaxID=84024 RepID=UPI002907240A|nr:MupG family TIM beta-alpha barrel fold protein [Clostridium celatum]
MKHELGISVYPDLMPLEKIESYFELASRYGVSKVFSSMFSVEGTKEEVLDYFKKLIVAAHKNKLKVSLDVNPMCFEKMGAKPDDLSVFKSIDVDFLRMDLSYGPENDAKLVRNPYGITIEFNNSPQIVKGLIENGIDPKDFLVCHNFYPQRYTAMKWNKFVNKNKELKACSRDVRIGAFISSTAPNTHGVWDAICGLPTVEKLRMLPIDLQARMLLATGDVDDILIGNAFASEDEFKKLQEVLKENEKLSKDLDPTLKMLVDHGIISLDKPVKKLRVTLDEEITEKEKEVLFDFFPHLEMGDSSEWIWRTRISRFKYSQPNEILTPRHYDKEMFEVGDVVVVNDNYKHYAGEIQIVKIPIVNDGTRNRIGYLDSDEYQMMELVYDGDLVEFLEK